MLLYEPLFQALNASGARYVVVGGVATVLHGYARLTADIDLIVDLESSAAETAMQTLAGLGLSSSSISSTGRKGATWATCRYGLRPSRT